MKEAEASGKFVYIPPQQNEAEESEFVDAPVQQPPVQSNSSIFFSIVKLLTYCMKMLCN